MPFLGVEQESDVASVGLAVFAVGVLLNVPSFIFLLKHL